MQCDMYWHQGKLKCAAVKQDNVAHFVWSTEVTYILQCEECIGVWQRKVEQKCYLDG